MTWNEKVRQIASIARSTLLVIIAVCLLVSLAGCSTPPEPGAPAAPTLFTSHAPDSSGITFANRLAERPALNIINYLYYYNGGGVAAGDVNNDGLVDLYFTANEGPNALYLNRGDFRFEDVTDAAGVAGRGDWTTGVTMVDINGDGWLDLYVSVVDGFRGLEGTNQLYVNNQDGTFSERAADYGLALRGYGTQTAFFDYDLDGDLDAYVLRHSTHEEDTFDRTTLRQTRDEEAGDLLLRNDDGQFVDVSAEAGIYSSPLGYGLGVAVSDFDRDGAPDLYIANDFHENDYLYYNEGDGTFTEAIAAATGHNSLSSMGVDAADINNDGRPDVAVLDMLPRQEAIRKTAQGPEAYDIYRIKRRFGYHPQFARNTLQLNQGQRRFSDIGPLAGIEATDWSWAPLLADLDNDGRKDLFVTNGIVRRPNDLDYIDYASDAAVQDALEDLTEDEMDVLERLPSVPIPNYAFRNTGDLAFEDIGPQWGLDDEGFSTGAAYADLDNDGDLDLVTNNINAPAALYENRADTMRAHHRLTIRLSGTPPNTQGIGARVTVVHDGQRQLLEQMPTRGYQSSVDPRLHVGLGARATVDSLTVVWPGGAAETRTNVAADQTITLRQSDATRTFDDPPDEPTDPLFTDATDALAIDYRHEENSFVDFDREILMPRKLSTEGPPLAVADVNGDGRDDVFIGGAKWQGGRLFLQQPGGGFAPSSAATFDADEKHEDVDAAFFDADGDGDLDLYVVSGGNEFWGTADALRDRLYLNDGRGAFTRAEGALPAAMTANGGAVAPGDFDGDGDLDLFVGGRVVARSYGQVPDSFLLENDGTGTFTDATSDRAPALATVGMVSDAAWADLMGDARLELVVVGAWMPIRVFAQEDGEDGRLVDRTAAAGLAQTGGWWNAVHVADLNGDGHADLVAGNLGRNALLRARPDEPARLYVADFDGDGQTDPVITHYRDGTSYPLATYEQLTTQIEPLRQQFPTHQSFGARTVDEMFSADQLEAATVREAHTFASSVALNDGDGTFTVRPLPPRAQLAPIYGIAAEDVDGDGAPDLLLGGNLHGVKPVQGRYDASYGHFLRAAGDGSFTAVPPVESNLYLQGEVRVLRLLRGARGQRYLLAARNDDRLQVIRVRTGDAATARR